MQCQKCINRVLMQTMNITYWSMYDQVQWQYNTQATYVVQIWCMWRNGYVIMEELPAMHEATGKYIMYEVCALAFSRTWNIATLGCRRRGERGAWGNGYICRHIYLLYACYESARLWWAWEHTVHIMMWSNVCTRAYKWHDMHAIVQVYKCHGYCTSWALSLSVSHSNIGYYPPSLPWLNNFPLQSKHSSIPNLTLLAQNTPTQTLPLLCQEHSWATLLTSQLQERHSAGSHFAPVLYTSLP